MQYGCLFIAALLAAIMAVEAQNFVTGRCPYVRPIKRFNAKKMAGRWFEIERTKTRFTNNHTCSVNEFLFGLPKAIRFVIRSYDRFRGRPVVVNANAIQNPAAKSQFGILFDPRYGRTAYNVLGTDYKTWALLFACRERYNDFGRLISEQALFLNSRSRGPLPSKIYSKAYGLARSYGIPIRHIERVIQHGCPAEY